MDKTTSISLSSFTMMSLSSGYFLLDTEKLSMFRRIHSVKVFYTTHALACIDKLIWWVVSMCVLSIAEFLCTHAYVSKNQFSSI
jgi:hypothetical protein